MEREPSGERIRRRSLDARRPRPNARKAESYAPALLAQFRYEDALFFVELALKDEMFWAYQSAVRIELRAQPQLLGRR